MSLARCWARFARRRRRFWHPSVSASARNQTEGHPRTPQSWQAAFSQPSQPRNVRAVRELDHLAAARLGIRGQQVADLREHGLARLGLRERGDEADRRDAGDDALRGQAVDMPRRGVAEPAEQGRPLERLAPARWSGTTGASPRCGSITRRAARPSDRRVTDVPDEAEGRRRAAERGGSRAAPRRPGTSGTPGRPSRRPRSRSQAGSPRQSRTAPGRRGAQPPARPASPPPAPPRQLPRRFRPGAPSASRSRRRGRARLGRCRGGAPARAAPPPRAGRSAGPPRTKRPRRGIPARPRREARSPSAPRA